MANLEELILSGALGNEQHRSNSPARSASTRSPSPGSKWPDEDYEEDDKKRGKDESETQPPHESIGMGPGRTGVKGVIRDRAEALATQRAKRSMEISALNRQMEKASLAANGRTWEEDERDRRAREGLDPLHDEEEESLFSSLKRYGYLREVGAGNYVEAVEDQNAKVVVHIYDPSLERCYELDSVLSRLAKASPSTKFIRVKATAIGYALKSATETGALGAPTSTRRNIRNGGDQTRFLVSEELETFEEDSEGEEDEGEADTDMLPTMLVYDKGELLHTWVRVDWEAGKDGVENLLFKHNLIARKSQPNAQGIAALSDDEEEED